MDPDRPAPGEDLLSEAFFRDRNVADLEAEEAGEPGPRRWVRGRLLPRLAGVLLVLALVDLAVRTALPPEALVPDMAMEAASYTVKVDRFAAAPAPDVLIMGSSRARDGLVPEVFAEALSKHWGRPASVFNLGLVNAKVEELYALATAHMPEPAPARVVLCLTGSEIVRAHNFQYASRFLWRRAQAVAYLRKTAWADLKMEEFEKYIESVLGRVWYVFGQRDALRARLLGALGLAEEPAYDASAEIEAFVSAPDGYVPPTHGGGPTLAQKLRRDPGSLRLPPRELRRPAELTEGGEYRVLRDTIAALRARGCEVALAELPSSPFLQEKSPVQHGHVFRRRMAELCEELGLVWVPYPAEANYLSNDLYTDINHLTPVGAQRYTAGLFRKLRDAGFLDP